MATNIRQLAEVIREREHNGKHSAAGQAAGDRATAMKAFMSLEDIDAAVILAPLLERKGFGKYVLPRPRKGKPT